MNTSVRRSPFDPPLRAASRARPFQRALVAATALAAASIPLSTFAQQPAVPPVGEPPPQTPQEQAAIEEQVRQAYLQQHKDELWKQAVSEVEQERRSAWEQRGRDRIPPAIVTKLPGVETTIAGRISALFSNEVGFGISSSWKLRTKKWWGVEAGGGIFSFREFSDAPPQGSRFIAPFAEISALGWALGGSSKGYTIADHGFLRAGMQLVFPLSTPNVPSVYLAPFAAFGGSFALGQFGKSKRSYAALVFESRFSYRFGLGSSSLSPIEGWAIDMIAGPAVGF